MPGKHMTPALAVLFVVAAGAQAHCQAPTEGPGDGLPPVAAAIPAPGAAAPSAVTPPAPGFQAGDRVFDSNGEDLGPIQTLAETPVGPMVVVQIDGKLVSLPQTSLRMDGSTISSDQTKAQILAAADAPQ